LVIDGKKFNNQQDLAEEFNKHFANVAEKIRKKKQQINNNYVTVSDSKNIVNYTDFMGQAFTGKYQTIFCKCSTEEEIEKIIKFLKLKNSYGYDEMSHIILKRSLSFITAPINYICNKMLRDGVFPDRLKYTYAIIRPLYKNGDIRDAFNYRPISHLTSLSKVFETVIYTRTLTHLNKYNILSSKQYGFRKGLRTDSAIYKLTTEILNSINNKHLVGGIFCDLEKAFDCIDHEVLLSKLKSFMLLQESLFTL
jgi:hypothetical protein